MKSAMPHHPSAPARWDIPILMYHDIRLPEEPDTPLAVTLDSFKRQLHSLKEWGFNTITFDLLHRAMRGQAELPANPVILTFDDGYISFHKHVTPLCRELQMTATVYLCADLFDREWFPGVYLMSEAEAREVLDAGMEIGVHGWHHHRLMEISGDTLRREIVDSRKSIADRFGIAADAYCYAYGKFSSALYPLLDEAGYASATAILSPYRTVIEEPYGMRRIQIHSHDLGARLRLKMTRLYLSYLGMRQSRDPGLQSLRVSSTNTSSKLAC